MELISPQDGTERINPHADKIESFYNVSAWSAGCKCIFHPRRILNIMSILYDTNEIEAEKVRK